MTAPRWVSGIGDYLIVHDPGWLALRRSARAAIVVPLLFALCSEGLHRPITATFAAFGAVSMLLFVDFPGPVRYRLRAHVALAVTGAVFICVATPVSRSTWASAVLMAVIGFAVLFTGVVSSVIAGATTALLLAFILPVSLPGAPSSIPDRLLGWVIARAAAMIAISLLWPARPMDPLLATAAEACGSLAAAIGHSPGSSLRSDEPVPPVAERAARAMKDLRARSSATPVRPAPLSTSGRALLRLIDQLDWLETVVLTKREHAADPSAPSVSSQAAQEVTAAAADALGLGAALLDPASRSDAAITAVETALDSLQDRLAALQEQAAGQLPSRPDDAAGRPGIDAVLTALDPGFRAQELGYITVGVLDNVRRITVAERRGWYDRLLGREPDGQAGVWAIAQRRVSSHARVSSVWLRNSVRGALALALAVAIADLTQVQHSFWVVLAALSVLRSSAVGTGQAIWRAVLGTAAGFAVGAVLITAVGADRPVLWALLPIAVFISGFAPVSGSFAAGQAAFTVLIVILFNLIQPVGWRVGLIRIEDVVLGFAVSLVVGYLFWPRGASAALWRSLAEAYARGAAYLAAVVEYAVDQCRPGSAGERAIADVRDRGVAANGAARRLDDAFRQYLAERGTKALPLGDVTRLVSRSTALRLASVAILDLWREGGVYISGPDQDAQDQLRRAGFAISGWYREYADALLRQDGSAPAAQGRDIVAGQAWLTTLRRDLDDEFTSETAVRMMWTSDHLDAARRLQPALVTLLTRAFRDIKAGQEPIGERISAPG
jgi:uncharacterized membrane protein YccC